MEENNAPYCHAPELKPASDAPKMHGLVKYIKAATGLSMGEFCEKELKTEYKAFNWRLKKSRLYPDEIVYMVWRTRKTVVELFGKPWHELIIDNSSGPVVNEVKDIMGKMSKTEARELERLMGLEPYKEHADERNRKKRQSKNQIKKNPLPPDAPNKDDSQESESPKDDPLKDMFKNTY